MLISRLEYGSWTDSYQSWHLFMEWSWSRNSKTKYEKQHFYLLRHTYFEWNNSKYICNENEKNPALIVIATILLQPKKIPWYAYLIISLLRKIAGRTKWDHIRSILVEQESVIYNKIEQDQLKWFRHLTRINEDILVKRVMETGRSCMGWRGKAKKKLMEMRNNREKTFGKMKTLFQNPVSGGCA